MWRGGVRAPTPAGCKATGARSLCAHRYRVGVDVRRGIAGLGRALIASGILILLFVAYQLWGTGLSEARAQDELQSEFEELLGTTTTTARPGTTVPGATTTTVRRNVPPPPPEGEAVAIMRIPRLDLEKAIVEGVGVADLKKAPGHYPTTPMPGQPGNAAIAGHRTTYGAPFYRLDELQPGDQIFVTTRQGRFEYEVTSTQIVSPKQVEVLAPTSDNRLTLTTCHPRFSARQRMIVVAALKGEAAEAPPPPPARDVTDEVEPEDVPEDEPEPTQTIDGESLSGDPAARTPTLLWGIAAAAVALVIWLIARKFRRARWPIYAVGALPFLLVLFMFFENMARLFPANI